MNTHVNELSDKQLEALGAVVSESVIGYLENKSKTTKDKTLYNTKLLLRNYNKLKAHCRVVGEQLEEDSGTFWNDGRLELNLLMENKAKTVKLMNQVDRAIEHYKADCMKANKVNETRRYDMIKMKYLNHKSLTDEEIADRYEIDRRTAQRNIEEAIDDISVYFFGIEAISK